MAELPEHIAIIMDGNGRWAKKRNLPRIMGHRSGVDTVDAITEACARLGVKVLTLYTFSSENWKRPRKEVDALMDLFKQSSRKREKKLMDGNIRFNVIGQLDAFGQALKSEIDDLVEKTASNTGMVLTLALNYGGRQEILEAVRRVCKESKEGDLDISSMDEKNFAEYLYTGKLPDPDLIIRTSGEMRLSNFLLWQAAYAELYVTDTLWPDFDAGELEKALKEYKRRERRFGG